MGGVRYQDLRALRFTSVTMESTNHQQSREFALCTGGGSERDLGETADLCESGLQLMDNLQIALHFSHRLGRMAVGKALQIHTSVDQLGVVLHGT